MWRCNECGEEILGYYFTDNLCVKIGHNKKIKSFNDERNYIDVLNHLGIIIQYYCPHCGDKSKTLTDIAEWEEE